MQERQTGGYQTAEAEGVLIRKQVILSPAAVTAGAVGPSSAEQTFDVLGTLATDFAVKGNPETVVPGGTGAVGIGIGTVRVAALSQIAINYMVPGTAVTTPTTGLLYTFLIYRR